MERTNCKRDESSLTGRERRIQGKLLMQRG